jgi:uncharacterized Zn finger protein
MDCPICGKDAEDITVVDFDGKNIRCKSCGDYDISGTVYDTGKLAEIEPNQRLAVLNKAKRFAGAGRRCPERC